MFHGKLALLGSAALLMAAPVHAETQQPKAEVQIKAPPAAASSNMTAAIQGKLAQFNASMAETLGMADLPPIDPVRLAAAQQLVGPMTQRASMEKLYNNLYSRLFEGFRTMGRQSERDSLLIALGVPADHLANVSQAEVKQVTAILNPNAAAQQQRYTDAMRPLVNEIFAVLLPAVQQGMARAYARQFTAEELGQIQSFFATPTGVAFAAELLPLQANPEVIMAMLDSAPELIRRVEKVVPTIDANFNALPRGEELREPDKLTTKEWKQLAEILKVDHKVLKANAAEQQAASKAEKEATAKAIEAATKAASEAAAAAEAYDRSNWSGEHKAAVEAIEARARETQGQLDEAETAAIKEANSRLSPVPKP